MSTPRLSCQLRLRYAARRSRMSGRSPRKSMSSLTWVTSCSRGSTKTSQRCFWQARTSVTVSSSRIAPGVSSSACGWCRSSTVLSSDGPPNSGSAKPSGSSVSRSMKPNGRRPHSGWARSWLTTSRPACSAPITIVGCATVPTRRSVRTTKYSSARVTTTATPTANACPSVVCTPSSRQPPSSIAMAISQRRRMHGRSSSTDSASRDRYRPPSWNNRIKIAANASSVIR